MRSVNELFPYQNHAVSYQVTHQASAVWMDPGLGKTVVTLTSIIQLLDSRILSGVLIVAPLRVCKMVWRQEALKWDHTNKLKFSVITGDRDQRMRMLMQKADVYLISYDNLRWLVEAINKYIIGANRPMPFDGVVFDEISKCKNSSTERVKALLKILPKFHWRTGLTGTPASNGYKDLHGQYLVLDGGKRLGTSKTQFETRWYKSDGPYKKSPYPDTEDGIKNTIGDMTLEMSAADYNPLPDMIVNKIEVELPPDIRAMYDQMERDLFVVLESGSEVELFNQAALTNKCLQFSNGACYPEPGKPAWEAIHDMKLDALEDIIEESNGQPVLCAYAYRSDAERIMAKFHHLNPINLTACHSEKELNNAMSRWVSGDCALMIGHPASMGHGIDGLQKSGNTIVWFGLNWSLDLYDQFNARLRRQGQGRPVICHQILCLDTIDQAQVLAIESKARTQTELRASLKNYMTRKKHE